MVAVFKYIRGRERERRIPCSPHQWQLEQEAMDLNCIRSIRLNQEKFPKGKEGEVLEQIACKDWQIFITGEFLKQIGIVCPDMGHRTDQYSSPIFCAFVYTAD